MKRLQTDWDTPYNESFFKTSHNSYSISVRKQLDAGVRGLEYDIHDNQIHELGDFEVYHLPNYVDVALGTDGNPDNLLLTNWLILLKEWSDKREREDAPITLFIELKDSIIDENNEPCELYGLEKLNKIILDSLSPDYLYQYSDFRKDRFHWPSISELKGKIIIVLTSYWGGYWVSNEGGFESRKKYLHDALESRNDVCFVAWIEEDKGNDVQFLKNNSTFWKCSLEYSSEHFEENVIAQRATRVDYNIIGHDKRVKTNYKQNFTSGYRANFISTDYWYSKRYEKSFPWVK